MILEHLLGQGKSARIFCTEPRRISAISLAQRVSQELGDAQGALGTRNSYVGYNIRLEARVSAATRLTYATTVRSCLVEAFPFLADLYFRVFCYVC
jgi:ATP-dependent RNA helicase DHX29